MGLRLIAPACPRRLSIQGVGIDAMLAGEDPVGDRCARVGECPPQDRVHQGRIARLHARTEKRQADPASVQPAQQGEIAGKEQVGITQDFEAVPFQEGLAEAGANLLFRPFRFGSAERDDHGAIQVEYKSRGRVLVHDRALSLM